MSNTEDLDAGRRAEAPDPLAGLRMDVAALRHRMRDTDADLELAERRLDAEERRLRRARQERMTERQLRDLETTRLDRQLIDFALDELRDIVLSAHDRAVLADINGRLSGYERDLVERLIAMTAPRSES